MTEHKPVPLPQPRRLCICFPPVVIAAICAVACVILCAATRADVSALMAKNQQLTEENVKLIARMNTIERRLTQPTR